MIAEAFMICALAVTPKASFAGNHDLTTDDGHAFLALTEPVRRLGIRKPPIVFVYNYYDLANQLRAQGIRAYSMTVGVSGSHVHGMLENIPFQPACIGALVLLQKVSYSNLFEAIDTVAMSGVMAIKDSNLPYLGEVILTGMGFRRTMMSWHDNQLYRRVEVKTIMAGEGYEVFNMKKVASPYLVHRAMLAAA